MRLEVLVLVLRPADGPLRLRPWDAKWDALDDGHQLPSAVSIQVRLALVLVRDEDAGISAVREPAIPDARLRPHSVAADVVWVAAAPCIPDAAPSGELSCGEPGLHLVGDVLLPDAGAAQLVSQAQRVSAQPERSLLAFRQSHAVVVLQFLRQMRRTRASALRRLAPRALVLSGRALLRASPLWKVELLRQQDVARRHLRASRVLVSARARALRLVAQQASRLQPSALSARAQQAWQAQRV